MCRCNCPRSIRPDVIDYRVDTPTGQRNVQVKPAPPCWICGGNPDAIVNAVKMGRLLEAWDTYAPNLAATAERERIDAERQQHARWHE